MRPIAEFKNYLLIKIPKEANFVMFDTGTDEWKIQNILILFIFIFVSVDDF